MAGMLAHWRARGLASRPVILLALASVWAWPACALATRGEVGALRYAIYAPEWTWQGCEVNLLVVITNTGAEARDVALTLRFPQGQAGDFSYDVAKLGDPPMLRVQVPAGATVRQAFTRIRPNLGAPLGAYAFKLELESGDERASVPYALRTIRGAAVGSSWWALYAPVAVALVWCGVFWVTIRRFAPPGAWRTPGPGFAAPVSEASHPERGQA